ncbi:helix-turn-helix domain-containing protein [Alicyclobacillus herbarius]|uniref:helix-turn-helix domain-containing protein n=1 Tax=Alicyclobacillus herbarius TaxID=122960 RepID=UPI0030811DB1
MGDLPLLAAHFIDKHNARLGTQVEGLDEAAMACLADYHWPGNVRELENTLEAAMNWVVEGRIGVDALPQTLKVRAGLDAARRQMHTADRPLRAAGGKTNLEMPEKAGFAHPSAHLSTGLDDPVHLPKEIARMLATSGFLRLWQALTPGMDAPVGADTPATTPDTARTAEALPVWAEVAQALERAVLERALHATGGNVTRASRWLKIPRQTLQYRLKQLNLRPR